MLKGAFGQNCNIDLLAVFFLHCNTVQKHSTTKYFGLLTVTLATEISDFSFNVDFVGTKHRRFYRCASSPVAYCLVLFLRDMHLFFITTQSHCSLFPSSLQLTADAGRGQAHT
jgi:hypothetical protein